MIKKCLTCGKAFYVPNCHAHRVHRCSLKCQGISRRKVGIEFNGTWYRFDAKLGYYIKTIAQKTWKQFRIPPMRHFTIRSAMQQDAKRWSRNKPTEPGWYWWRHNACSPVHATYLERGNGCDHDGLWYAKENMCVPHNAAYVPYGEWQGPIFPSED